MRNAMSSSKVDTPPPPPAIVKRKALTEEAKGNGSITL